MPQIVSSAIRKPLEGDAEGYRDVAGLAEAPLGEGYRDLRKKLKQDGVGVTIEYAFDAPSLAAAMVAGTGLNGRPHWKVKGEGISQKDWQERQVAATGEQD
jgi:hypothetical protein